MYFFGMGIFLAENVKKILTTWKKLKLKPKCEKFLFLTHPVLTKARY
jgi:hypothetical protein